MHALHSASAPSLSRPRARASRVVVLAASSPTPPPPAPSSPSPSPSPSPSSSAPKPPPKLPTRGYFAEANPNAEVYSKAGKKFDPDKKAGRWDPEFIWNTNWQEALELQEQATAAREEAARAAASAQPPSGFLNLARLDDLNAADADLSAQLQAPARPSGPPKIELPNMTTRPAYSKPTQLEARKWTRGAKFSDKPVAMTPAAEEAAAEEAARIAAERAKYEQLKAEFQAWTLGLAGFTFGITWAFYTRDVAVSYLLGAAGGLMYLRLLNRQVDGIGGGDIGGAVGPPRLLVPVILVLAFNRWNEMAVEQTGITLGLIPMLLGFFTYKGGVIARQSLQLMNDLIDDTASQGADRRQVAAGRLEGAREAGKPGQVPSIDDALAKKILSQ